MTDGQLVQEISGYSELKRINDQLAQDNAHLMMANNKLSHDITGVTQDQQQLQHQLTTERMMRKKMALQLERDTASKISGMYMYM